MVGHRSEPLPRLSKLGKHPAALSNGNRPLPLSSLPSHFRHTSNPLPTPARSKHGLSWSPANFLSVPAYGKASITVRLFPPESRRLDRLVPISPNPWGTSGVLNSYGSLIEFCFTSTAKLPVLRTMTSDSDDSFLRGNLEVNDCFREEQRRRCSLPAEGGFLTRDGGGGGAALAGGETAVR